MDKRTRQLSRGYGAVFATIAIWSVPSLFQFYLNRFYDPWSQNFYRYCGGLLAIIPFVAFAIRRGGPRIDMRAVNRSVWSAVFAQRRPPNHAGDGACFIWDRVFMRFSFGLRSSSPRLLALAFFPEERFRDPTMAISSRHVARFNRRFRSDLVSIECESGSARRLPGLFIAFTASLCWALYATLIKRPSARLGPIRSFGIVSIITSLLCFR